VGKRHRPNFFYGSRAWFSPRTIGLEHSVNDDDDSANYNRHLCDFLELAARETAVHKNA
jgi:hypothetical protein